LRIDASTPGAECLVFTSRSGLLSPLGHDLELRVEAFTVEFELAAGRLAARFDARSLRVVRALREGRESALSAAERREIERHIVDEVLEPAKLGDIEFHATEIGESSIAGILRLHGRERPLSFPLRVDGGRAVAEVKLHQPDFAIRPYSALLGSLRVHPDVRVRITLPYDVAR
jgi:hypothetical protein